MSRKNISAIISEKGGLTEALRQANEKLAADRERKCKASAPAESSKKDKSEAAPAEKFVFGGMKDPKSDPKRKASDSSTPTAKKRKEDHSSTAPKLASDHAVQEPSSLAELTPMQRRAMAKSILAIPDIEETSEQLLRGPKDPYVALVSAIAEMACVAKAFGKKKVSWEKKERDFDSVLADRAKEQKQARLKEEQLEKASRAERADFKAEIDRLKRQQKENKIKEDKLAAENAMLRAEVVELSLRPTSQDEVVEEFLLSNRYAAMQNEETEATFLKVCRRFMRCLDKMQANVDLQALDSMLVEEPDFDDEAAEQELPDAVPTGPAVKEAGAKAPSDGPTLIPLQAASPIFIPSSPFGEGSLGGPHLSHPGNPACQLLLPSRLPPIQRPLLLSKNSPPAFEASPIYNSAASQPPFRFTV